MAMTTLGLEETPEKFPPKMRLSPGRVWALIILAVCVFGVSSILLLRVVPPPYTGLDYMIVGTLSVMAALLVIFLLLLKTNVGVSDLLKGRDS
jgi:hypothetical protein